MDKTPRIRIPPQVRQYVIDRDHHQCQSCGGTSDLAIDHIIPLAAGGTNDISNFQTLCRRCNSRKRDGFDPRFQRRFDG